VQGKKKLCALGSAVGSLFLGLAWCARRYRCWLHRLYFYGGAPVLAAQVYSQCGEYSGPSQSSGHVFFSFGMAIFSGGGNVFVVLEIFEITG